MTPVADEPQESVDETTTADSDSYTEQELALIKERASALRKEYTTIQNRAAEIRRALAHLGKARELLETREE